MIQQFYKKAFSSTVHLQDYSTAVWVSRWLLLVIRRAGDQGNEQLLPWCAEKKGNWTVRQQYLQTMGGSFRVRWSLACSHPACVAPSSGQKALQSPGLYSRGRAQALETCTDGVFKEQVVPECRLSSKRKPPWMGSAGLIVLPVTTLSDCACAPRLIYPILMRHLYSILEPSKNMHLLLMGCAVKFINIVDSFLIWRSWCIAECWMFCSNQHAYK